MKRRLPFIVALALLCPACQPAAAPSEAADNAPVEAPVVAATPPVVGASPLAWCRVTGSPGEQQRCPLRLDGATAAAPVAGLQFSLNWDATTLAFEGIESTVCPPAGSPCVTVMSPPMKSLGKAGHSLATKPIDLSTAAGAATLMVYHASNPNAVLPSEVGQLVFRVLKPATATSVRVSEAVATAPDATTLSVLAVESVLRVGP